MTATLTAEFLPGVRIHPVTAVDGAGEPCDQCDREDCVNEAQMYYFSLFSGNTFVTGSLVCLARLYRRDADFETEATIEVQR